MIIPHHNKLYTTIVVWSSAQRYAATCTAILLIILVWWFIACRTLYTAIAHYNNSSIVAQQEHEQHNVEQELRDKKIYYNQLLSTSAQIIEWINRASSGEVIGIIMHTAASEGLGLDELAAHKEKQEQEYSYTPYTIKIQGDYFSLISFFEKLHDQMLVCASGMIKKIDDVQVAAECTIYHYNLKNQLSITSSREPANLAQYNKFIVATRNPFRCKKKVIENIFGSGLVHSSNMKITLLKEGDTMTIVKKLKKSPSTLTS